MNTNHTNHDDAIDKTLAALKTAAPPQGMEARILQRLQQHVPAAEFSWSDLFARTALAGAWWRGAITGAATAMLLVGALLLAQHSLRTRPGHAQPAVSQVATARNLAPAVVPVATSASARDSHANPCVTPGQLRTTRAVPIYRAESTHYASFAPSHPAPALPLTAQERALVQLAQTADPKVLAALSPEARAKTAAQEADDFNKFFTPPPQLPDTASPTNIQENRTSPQQGEQI